MGRILAALAVLAVVFAAPVGATTDQQVQFMADVDQHGGLTTSQVFTVQDGKGTTLGNAVCNELKGGVAAANEVTEVANRWTHCTVR